MGSRIESWAQHRSKGKQCKQSILGVTAELRLLFGLRPPASWVRIDHVLALAQKVRLEGRLWGHRCHKCHRWIAIRSCRPRYCSPLRELCPKTMPQWNKHLQTYASGVGSSPRSASSRLVLKMHWNTQTASAWWQASENHMRACCHRMWSSTGIPWLPAKSFGWSGRRAFLQTAPSTHTLASSKHRSLESISCR